MTARQAVRRWGVCLVLAAGAGSALVLAQAPPTPEDVARRQYASGVEFLKAGRHAEALKDFQTVVDSYPSTSVADDALLAIARYQLDIANDAAAAQATAESVLKRFPASDSVAMAYVVAGQAMVRQGLTQTNVDAALASFERVPRLFPGTPAVAPALHAAGDTLRRLGRCPEALERFGRVVLEYPRSDWAARSRLSSATCLARAGRIPDAMAAVNRVSTMFENSGPGLEARTLGTILYRLHIRPPAQPAFVAAERTVSGPDGRLRNVSGLALGGGHLFVASRTGVRVLDKEGGHVRSAGSGDIRDVAVDRSGRAIAIQRALVVRETTPGQTALVTLTVPRPQGGAARVLDDLTAIALLSSGDLLVADRSSRTVYRFDDGGAFVAQFAQVRAASIAVDESDRVALLDRDTRTVTVYDRNAKPVTRIATKGTGYELQSPSGLAFDALGHLYVLDRSSVTVFAPGAATPLVTFSDQGRAGGGWRNPGPLAIDAAGRLYIYDGGTEQVLVYR